VIDRAFLRSFNLKYLKNMKTMKGAFLPGNSTVVMKDVEIPEPGYGQVLIKTKSSTICGSDIRAIYREHLGKGPEA
jgi:threonine dehydrogenase-like Zn-dependent dehydrogenase